MFSLYGLRYTYNTIIIISREESLTFGIVIHLKKATRVFIDPKLNLRELNKFLKIQAEGISDLFLTLLRPWKKWI
jgi:hypothetical protein